LVTNHTKGQTRIETKKEEHRDRQTLTTNPEEIDHLELKVNSNNENQELLELREIDHPEHQEPREIDPLELKEKDLLADLEPMREDLLVKTEQPDPLEANPMVKREIRRDGKTKAESSNKDKKEERESMTESPEQAEAPEKTKREVLEVPTGDLKPTPKLSSKPPNR